ncbi:hypothetical protein [Gordonia aurantiaca]|uniref:hypothetical protein n=1 Tax=Gordonia sp. B21 TaxID=3151852 RepID=UPI0032672A83
MRILLLDCNMEIDAARARFDSTHSLYDYDMVIWDPHSSMQAFRTSGSYGGLPRISDHDSPSLRQAIARRRNDFEEFLKLGRTLVVFLPGDARVYVDSGERQYSGTGRNRHTTTIVTRCDILDSLPKRPKRWAALGDEMEPADSSIGPLYRQTSEWWCYACIIECPEDFRPLLRIKGTPKVTAACTAYLQGDIVFLPVLVTGAVEDDDDDVDDISGSRVASAGYDSVDEVDSLEEDAGGDEIESDSSAVDRMVLDWLLSFCRSDEIVWPDWVGHYLFRSEVQRSRKLDELRLEMARIQAEMDGLEVALESDQQWKLLVAGSGTLLEEAVARALTAIGFKLQPTIPGRTDVRGEYGEIAIVVETKGVTKSAAESHCAQLEKWVAEELELGRTAKGILVINSYRDQPPLARTKPTFPDQMRRYAEMREHCLVSGLQLLIMARTALAEPERCGEIADVLLTTVGVIDGWDDLNDIFEELPPSRRREDAKANSQDTGKS